MSQQYPTQRPMDVEYRDDGEPTNLPAEMTNIPWIDVHNHAYTLSWNDREKFALSGCHSMVMMAAAYYWMPYKPVAAADVRYLWDDALNRLAPIRDTHPFDATVGIDIHTGARVGNYKELLDLLPEYCALEEIAAVGESRHHGGPTRLQVESRGATRGDSTPTQGRRDYDLSVILHTPADLEDVQFPDRVYGSIPGYELDLSLQQKPILTGAYTKRDAIEIDLELKDEAGLPDDRLVLSHADKKVAPYILENTDCYCSFTISYPGFSASNHITLSSSGPEHILVETDSVGFSGATSSRTNGRSSRCIEWDSM